MKTDLTTEVKGTVEVQGSEKPACVAECIVRLYGGA